MITIVRIQHVRRAGMCARGAREFFLRHALSWEDFLQNGIDAAILDRTGDVMAKQVADLARKEQSSETR